MAVSIENVSHSGGIAERARKGKNAPHYMMAAPVMLGSFDVTTVCGNTLGSSADNAIEMGTDVGGTLCKRCEKIYGAMLERQAEAREDIPAPAAEAAPVVRELNATDVQEAIRTSKGGAVKAKRAAAVAAERKRLAAREDSAPALPGVDAEIIASTGKTLDVMREETAAFYADGGKPSREITTLGTSGKGVVDTTVMVCEFKGDVEIINPERTHGKCPECTSYIPLQDVKSDPDAQRIGKHNVGGVATPASKGLSSKALDTVEHGSVPGDPGDADKRRRAESLCDRSGKVARGASAGVKTCTGCARPVELREVKGKGDKVSYRYPDHTDARDTFVRAPHGERKVTPGGTGADVGATVQRGARLAMGRGQGSVDGSATTGSQNMPPVQPKGWLAVAGTMSLPAMVRPGIDPDVMGKLCPVCRDLPEIAHKGRSRGWRRAHSRQVAAILRDRQAQRDAARERDIAAGERLAAGERKAARKAASVGSFAEGNVNGDVSHTARPEHTPKGERKAAPRRATQQEKADARKALDSVK